MSCTSSYVPLGSRFLVGGPDTSGYNSGNWTVPFTPDIFNINMPAFEVYKIVIHGAPGSTFNVFVDLRQWDTSVRGDLNSWDPMQPLIMLPGQSLLFYWSDPITDNLPPEVTLWMRYDLQNPQNLRASLNPL